MFEVFSFRMQLSFQIVYLIGSKYSIQKLQIKLIFFFFY